MTSRKNLKSPKKPRSTSKKNKRPIKNSQKSKSLKNRMKKISQKKKRGGAELSEEEERIKYFMIDFFEKYAALKEKIDEFKVDVYHKLLALKQDTKQQILKTINSELNQEQQIILFDELGFKEALINTPVSTQLLQKEKEKILRNLK